MQRRSTPGRGAVVVRVARVWLAAGMVLGAVATAGAAPVPTLGLDFTGGNANSARGATTDDTVGYYFDVLSPVTVVSLGVWDEGADGLNYSHQIGLWDYATKALLASATVTNASSPVDSASPDGRWLFESIASVQLLPGRYAIAAVYTSGGAPDEDPVRENATASTPAPISYVQPAHAAGGLSFPSRTYHQPFDAWMGPSFEIYFDPIAVPEPGTVVLAALGALGAIAGGRRRS